MTDKCQVKLCMIESQFTCICDVRLKLCKTHLLEHIYLEGSHRGFTLQDLPYNKLKLGAENLIKNLENNRFLIQNQCQNLINEILSRMQQINEFINQKQKKIMNLLISSNSAFKLEKYIEKVKKNSFKIEINSEYTQYIKSLFKIDKIENISKDTQDIIKIHKKDYGKIEDLKNQLNKLKEKFYCFLITFPKNIGNEIFKDSFKSIINQNIHFKYQINDVAYYLKDIYDKFNENNK